MVPNNTSRSPNNASIEDFEVKCGFAPGMNSEEWSMNSRCETLRQRATSMRQHFLQVAGLRSQPAAALLHPRESRQAG
jgi:hypothetical protein